MARITILTSELDALEKTIKAQEQIILDQYKMIKLMKDALVLLGALPVDPAPITPARPVG